VSFCSHWDWYIRKLSEFIVIHHFAALGRPFTTQEEKDLQRIDRLTIPQQLTLIEQACNTQFELSASQRANLREMSLVRNLGLHNRWEVDGVYLAKSSCNRHQVGHLREFDVDELRNWHQSLLSAVQITSIKIAIRFKNAPKHEI
jgi:hypothetical protein